MKFLPILFMPLLAWGSSEIEDAKKSVQSLIRPLLSKGSAKGRPKGTENFSVDGCERKKINWTNILLLKEKVTLVYSFSKNCDIEGTISPSVLTPFPADLKLRNIQSYSRLKSQNRITAQLESKPILNLSITEGFLTGKNNVKFEADYRVRINPLSKKEPLEENLGGELRISEINGKKMSIKEKILVQ